MKLYEHGELNQSRLMSYCGLNTVRHRGLIDNMVKKGMISKTLESWGTKTIIKYKISQEGTKILREVLEQYEVLFPRDEDKKP
jgi:predicted transcriptional regulator